MSNKKVLTITILSILTVVILIIGIVLFSINKKERTILENMDIVKSNYAKIISNTTDSENIKADLIEKIENFNNETYEEEHRNYVKTLKNYDENVRYINKIVEDMEKRCEYKYDDTVVRLLCKGYDVLYEEAINSYITHVNEYNDKLSKYNETATKRYNPHELVFAKYIDYDKDGEYEGK